MAKRPSLDRLMNDLGAVKQAPAAPASRDALLRALSSGSSVVVEKAARIVGELKLTDFGAEMAAAFNQMMGVSDVGCAAKIALARALLDTGAGDEATGAYQRGIRHRQREGPTDVAGPLRGYCGLGLLSARHRDAMVELTDLLADPEPAARIAAARGLASTGREEAGLLMRLRLTMGERSPEVVTECLVAVLRLDPARSLPLAARFLGDDSGEMREAAALALGESGHPGALDLLRGAYQREPDTEIRRTLLVAAGLLRETGAADWLISVVENGAPDEALSALQSIRVRRRDAAVAARLRAVIAERRIAALQLEIDRHWTE